MLTNDDSRLGTTVESYRLVRVLGSGSTSVVYLGQRVDDPATWVAVKVLTLSDSLRAADRMAFQVRFLRESRAASRLRHEHILPVLSFGEADDVHYMVMPVIAGGTLTTVLASSHGPLPLSDIAHYLRQLASALDFAHTLGIVHRDVKPSNILVDESATAYLTDFGIARLFDAGGEGLTRIDGQGNASLTHTGEVLGTPYYMAPEQIKGEPVGPATDVYALGIVTYQLVTGQLPYPGETPLAVAMQHLQETPCPPALLREQLPASAEAAILRAIEKQPANRFASAGAFAQAFSTDIVAGTSSTLSDAANATRPASVSVSVSLNRATLLSDHGELPTLVVPPGSSPGSASSASPGPSALSPGSFSPGPLGPSSVVSRSAGPPPGSLHELSGATVGHYRLDQLIESDTKGAVFEARSLTGDATYRIRILPVHEHGTPEASSLYLGRFQQLAHDIAALHHPYILALLDYGSYHGMPYLVSPQVAGPSLSTQMAQGGAMDLLMAGRYLDQISAALEYAHEHGVFHRNLTGDCIYPNHEGHVVVADFEIRRLIELSGRVEQPLLANPPNPAAEAYVPEQLLGQSVDASSDVYALGCLLYQMLTGHPVFTGETRREIVEQHLHAAAPPLRRWRAGLPAGLENVVARALARDRGQRFRHPGELANAYRQLVTQPGSGEPFLLTQRPGVSAVRRADGSLVAGELSRANQSQPAETPAVYQPGDADSGMPRATGAGDRSLAAGERGTLATDGQTAGGGTRSQGQPWMRRRGVRIALGGVSAVVLLVAAFAGGTALFGHHGPSSPRTPVAHLLGNVVFLDSRTGSPGHTDALNIDISGLAPPGSDAQYDAWLVDNSTEAVLPLGTLAAQGRNFVLDYSGSATPGVNLLGAGNTLEITLEHGQVQAPAGAPVLVGTFPPLALNHIRHLLVMWTDTPGHIGFLVGLLEEAQLLSAQGALLQQSAQSNRPADTQCLAQSMIDIIEGSNGTNYQPLSPQCISRNITLTGDGYGLLHNNTDVGYLEGAAEHASLAAQQPDATPHIKSHAQHVEIAVANIKQWVTTIDQDALNLLNNPGDQNTAQTVATLCDHAYRGVDTNGDEQVDPVPGEAGAITAYQHGQLLALLDLAPPK